MQILQLQSQWLSEIRCIKSFKRCLCVLWFDILCPIYRSSIRIYVCLYFVVLIETVNIISCPYIICFIIWNFIFPFITWIKYFLEYVHTYSQGPKTFWLVKDVWSLMSSVWHHYYHKISSFFVTFVNHLKGVRIRTPIKILDPINLKIH